MNSKANTLRDALAALKSRNFPDAERGLKKILKSEPSNIEALNFLTVTLTNLQRFVEAEDYISKAVKLYQGSDVSHCNYGIVLKCLNRPTQALEQFDAAIRLSPKLPQIWNNRGTVYHDLRQYERAISDFNQAILLDPDRGDAFGNKGKSLSALGRYDEAIAAFDSALALNPNSADAWLGRGIVFGEQNRASDALIAFERALVLNPSMTEARIRTGNVLCGLRRYSDALAAFDKALTLKTDLVGALLGRGLALVGLNEYDAALAAFERVLAQRPDLALAWLCRGDACYELERFEDAAAAYDRALALIPDYAEAWIGRGNVFGRLQNNELALAAYDKVLALRPDLAAAWFGRGNVLRELKRIEEALSAYDRAIGLAPDLADAWLGRGKVLSQLDRHADAQIAYAKALDLKPDFAEAWLGRGDVLHEFVQYDEALAAFNRAIDLKPGLAEAWLGRADTLRRLAQYDEALTALDRAISIKPDFAEAWQIRGLALLDTRQEKEALAAFDKAILARPRFVEAISGRIFALDFVSGIGSDEQQKARTIWWQEIGAAVFERSQIHHLNTRDPDRRIRVGYVSADFRNHSAALGFRPVLLNHDKTQVEITCYSSTPVDQLTEEFQRAADRWRDVIGKSDDDICAQIQADQIDILVDLSGHSAGNRLGVFARKPAPVQVTAWGHATGTGLPTIDYLFSDPVACPPGVRGSFAEKIFDLPCLISIDPIPCAAAPLDPPALSNGYVTFGVFNRASKISDEAISLWALILQSLPGSKILLKHGGFDVESVRSRVLKKFSGHGVSGDRIAFLGATLRQDHLAAFNRVDISLDPFPMGGGISTWESLQMGVPVVAKLGNTIASRLGGAIVTSVGLGDWVSETADGYLATAVKYAAMPERLKALRVNLPAMISASAAGNSVTYTKAVETAYRQMWTGYCEGSPA